MKAKSLWLRVRHSGSTLVRITFCSERDCQRYLLTRRVSEVLNEGCLIRVSQPDLA